MQTFRAFVIAAVFLLLSVEVAALTLAKDGSSDYTIVVAKDATVPERTAATELQEHLKAVTGASLPIVDEAGGSAPVKQIVVGQSVALKQAFPKLDLGALKQDGIVMKTDGETLYLAGGRPRGSLNAVYTFLEEVVGCRWWSSTESYAPNKPTLLVPPLNITYVPALLYREAFYRDAVKGVFAARSRCNGHFDEVPAEYGGHYSILGWCHTFYQLLPPEKYFAAHPEWYSEIDGKRTKERAQLCLTNEPMRVELVKNALEWIRKDPAAGVISITQNDFGGPCQCSACAAVEKEEGGASGLLLRFVNAVADDISKEFPDFLVETLAYDYTRHAPKLVRPRDNVIIRLCSIESSFCEPLATGPRNADFRRNIEAWKAIAKRLYIWDYVANFREFLLPHPNWQALAPNVRFFVANNCIGLFEQGDIGSSCGEFVELRAWLLAHLMWDPARDQDSLINEFLTGYYGAAAEPLRQYIDLMSDTVTKANIHLGCFMGSTDSWLGLSQMNEAEKLFRLAEKKVEGDSVLTARVRRARLPLTYAWLNRFKPLSRMAYVKGEAFDGPKDAKAACEAFVGSCNEFGMEFYGEKRPFKDLETNLRYRFCVQARAPELCKNLSWSRWLDIQDGEFLRPRRDMWAQLVDDPAASDGRAARFGADHTQWAVQFYVTKDMVPLAPLHAYAVARCNPKTATGNAFQVGAFDRKAGKHVVQRTMTIEETKGDYHVIDLGSFQTVSPDTQFWFAPLNNPNEVNDVFIDRMFFVRE